MCLKETDELRVKKHLNQSSSCVSHFSEVLSWMSPSLTLCADYLKVKQENKMKNYLSKIQSNGVRAGVVLLYIQLINIYWVCILCQTLF